MQRCSSGWSGRLLAVLVTVIAAALITPASASAAQGFDQTRAADIALSEVGSQRPTGWNAAGECIVSVRRWIQAAGGTMAGGGVMSSYRNSAAELVATGNGAVVAKAVKGDVVQYVNDASPEDFAGGVHTVMVVANNGDGTLWIVQSNASPVKDPGRVTDERRWTPRTPSGFTAYLWRFGQLPTSDVARYRGKIVQWDGDRKTQKTSWLVTPDLKRLWIPDAATYNCLTTRGAAPAGPLPSGTLDRMPDQSGKWAVCGDSLYPDRVLRRNMNLTSADGRYRLWLQDDGNLVLYGPSGRALWANGRTNSQFVILQQDGNVVTYTDGGGATWNTGTTGRGGNRLVVQNDGNLVLYAGGRPAWASNTAGRA